jgi:thiamine pyrophosphate-dependent acetolactate synthase large subunit-like protein
VIIVGHGARFAMDEVSALAERLGAPVLTTFKAKGQISDSHPLGCGVLGRSGTPIASWFMNEADLLLVFGASFSNHTGITPKIPTIQVDFDQMALGKFHEVACPVWGEIGVTARLLSEQVSGSWLDQRDEVATRWAIWRDEKARRRSDDQSQGLAAAAVFESLGQIADEDAVIAIDVGNNAYSFGRYFECAKQSVLMSGYLGSIGFSLPAAMGAWAAVRGKRQVISVSGDGGFGQYGFELTTAVKYGMNITHVLLDNGELGKITKEQKAGAFPVWQTSLQNPDFAAFAELCGAKAVSVRSPDELDAGMAEALGYEGPSLLHIHSDGALI